MSALVAAGITWRYADGADPVLRDVSVRVSRGEVLGVVGPNGAGKSTLLRVLAGVSAPQAGSIRLLGDDVTALPRAEVARRVALVAQRERVPAGLTVHEVVSMGRAPHTGWFGVLAAGDEAAVARALARCDLAAYAARSYETLSGGEQKRCLVARAVAQEAAVMVLDEPVASLDLAHQLAVCELLTERAKEGVAVVVVLHDLNLAARCCDRLLVLRDGRATVDPVAEVLTRERLREVFEVEAYVGECPGDGRPFSVAWRRAHV